MSKIEKYMLEEGKNMDKQYELICELIRLRKSKKISQRELCEKAGIDQPSLARIESGRHNPSLKMLVKVLDILGYEIRFVRKRK